MEQENHSKLLGVQNNKWVTLTDENGQVNMPLLLKTEKIRQGGCRHRPVLHSEIYTRFKERAENLGVKLIHEKFAISCDGFKAMYVADIESERREDYGLSCGWRGSTNSTQSFAGIFGTNCWCCGNGCVSGIVKPSCQRNTVGNYEHLGDKINIVFDRFNTDKEAIHGQIETIRHTPISDSIIGKFLTTIIKEGSIGNKHICDIIRELDNPTVNKKDDDSCFKLLNAATWVCTHDIKNLSQGAMASRVCNNTLLKIIGGDGFKPLGDNDDVIDVDGDVIAA